MYQNNWLKQLGTSFFGRSRAARQFRYGSHERRRPSTRPFLEALEDRALLSGGLPYPTPSNASQLTADIVYANSNAGSYTITLEAGTPFQFSSANNSTNGGNALPVITGNITIVGNGDTIERYGTLVKLFRLFDVASGGSLTLENLTLQFGLVKGQGNSACGGAIFSSGALNLGGVTVQSNTAEGQSGSNRISPGGGGNGGMAAGGGIYVAGGTLVLSSDHFKANLVQGGNGGNGYGDDSTKTSGYTGGNGGDAYGGGVFVDDDAAILTLNGDTFDSNSVYGGNGGNAASTGPFGGYGGGGGQGGWAFGGGLYVEKGNQGNLAISNDYLSGNNALGGHGGDGGNGSPSASAGSGGGGGMASGGGLYVTSGGFTLNGDSISDNAAQGGNGGSGAQVGKIGGGLGGKGGNGYGGGVYATATTTLIGNLITLINTVISPETVKGGMAGQPSIGGGGEAFSSLIYGKAMTLTAGSPLPPSTVGTPYSQTISALPVNSNSSTATLSYNPTSSLLGLNFSVSASGNQLTFSGTPTASGTVTFTVTATDSDGSTQPQDYTLTVNPAPPTQQTPAITSANNATFNPRLFGNFTVTATGSPTPTLTESGTLPSGVAFHDNGNGTATLFGFPEGPSGTYRFTITAHNGVGNDATQDFTLTVPPPISPPPPPPSPSPSPPPPPAPPSLNVPSLLASLDSLLGGVETVNANGTETITDSLFGFPLLVSTFDAHGNLVSVDMFGIDITFLFL